MKCPKPVFSLTVSLIQTYLDCPFKFYLEYVRRLSPKVEPTYFTWGRIWHEVVSNLQHDKLPDETVEDFREQIEQNEHLKTNDIAVYEKLFNLVPYVFDAYLLRWSKLDRSYETIIAEEEFEIPLWEGQRQTYVFRGKIDRIVRDVRDGKIYAWEIKTPGQTGPSYWRQLLLDKQIKSYLCAIQHAIGYQTNSVMYEVYQKPSPQERAVRDSSISPEAFAERFGTKYVLENEKYLQRQIINFEQWEVDQQWRELQQLAQQIDWAMENTIYPKHHPKNRIGSCQFQQLCELGEENPASMDKLIERPSHQHNPELTNA